MRAKERAARGRHIAGHHHLVLLLVRLDRTEGADRPVTRAGTKEGRREAAGAGEARRLAWRNAEGSGACGKNADGGGACRIGGRRSALAGSMHERGGGDGDGT